MTIEEARADWIKVRPEYDLFAQALKARLSLIARELGLYADVSARAKDVPSLVKKLLKKDHLSYETLPDKVGVRVILRYRSELPLIEECVRKQFAYLKVDDKAVELGTNKVGYQSIHIDSLAFLEADSNYVQFPPNRFFAELQIRTMSQHLWADVSHDTFYKNDELVQQVPPALQRRVNLTAGLVEVADLEFDRMNMEAKPTPASEIFSGLEKMYYSVASTRPDVELSLEVISLVLPLYGDLSPHEILTNYIYPRFEANRGALAGIYANPDLDLADTSAFLFQPEAILLLDRLHIDRDQLLAKWNEKFPERELERVAADLGFSLQ